MAATWLKDAVFYEIYPQSFYDSNGDGIGDIRGIMEKLDYIQALGCNALWLNPLYDSPFRDAGYDVRDHKQVASRYGTNEDLRALFQAAREKGIRILLDLVPGHTSDSHPWFQKSREEGENPCSHRYIWTDNVFHKPEGLPCVAGEAPRNGSYVINFFHSQPALNYGFRKITDPTWQMSYQDPEPKKTREEMKDIMRFWLTLGCDGFRVDMADSLVKLDGEDKSATVEVWQDISGAIHQEFPEAALVSEWNKPQLSLAAGFDMDFYLDWRGNGYSTLLRDYDIPPYGQPFGKNESYFCADGSRDITRFVEDYVPQYEASKDMGLWCLITGNHDTIRMAPLVDAQAQRLYFAFLMTMPGAPFIYYGDEIGMRYRWVPTKEGGYQRTGSRTPMQWSRGKNLGFSTADLQALYLSVDPAADAAVADEQISDPTSLWNHVKGLIHLRKSQPELGNYAPFQVYHAQKGGKLFAYRRGKLLVAMNPGKKVETLALDKAYQPIYAIGEPALKETTLKLAPQSFVILKPVE